MRKGVPKLSLTKYLTYCLSFSPLGNQALRLSWDKKGELPCVEADKAFLVLFHSLCI